MRGLALAALLLAGATPHELTAAAAQELAAAAAPGAAAASPQRIVSLNLCTDAYAMLLAPERTVGVTFLAADPSLSVVADRVAQVREVRAVAESVLALRPDLVLAGEFSATLAVARLRARGVRVEVAASAHDFAAVRAETLRLGALLGAEVRARTIVTAMDATLAAITPVRRTVLGLFAGRYSGGPEGILHAAILASGGTDMGTGGRMGLERLLAEPPELLLTTPPAAYPSLSTAALDHPALAGIARRRLPQPLTLCAGPWSAEAARLIAQP